MSTLRKRRSLRATYPSSEEDEDSNQTDISEQNSDSDTDPSTWLTDRFDAEIYNRSKMLLHVVDANCRNQSVDFDLNKSSSQKPVGHLMFDAVNRVVTDLRFLTPLNNSYKWNEGFVDILNRSHSMRILNIESEAAKEIIRRTQGRCAVCGTFEKSCTEVVDLCGSCDDEPPFQAHEWFEDIQSWPRLFDTFLPTFQRVIDDGCSGSENTLPSEYFGRFSIGKNCLQKLQVAFHSQVYVMELLYRAWIHLVINGDVPHAKLPSVTPEAISHHIETLDALKASSAGMKPPPVPFCKEFWDKIDIAIHRVSRGNYEKELEICGRRARQSMGILTDHEQCGQPTPPRSPQLNRFANHSVAADERIGGEITEERVASHSFGSRRKAARAAKKAQATEDVSKQMRSSKRRAVALDSDDDENVEDYPLTKAIADSLSASYRQTRSRTEAQIQEEKDIEQARQNSLRYGQACGSSTHTDASVPSRSFPPFLGAMRSAQSMRIPGSNLPSYKRTVTELLHAAALQNEQGRCDEATVSTQGAWVIQELLEKLERVRQP